MTRHEFIVFMWGLGSAVPITIVVILLLALLKRIYVGWLNWFKNLPLVSYPGMWLILLGQSMLGRRHWETTWYDNKLWLHLKNCPKMKRDQ